MEFEKCAIMSGFRRSGHLYLRLTLGQMKFCGHLNVTHQMSMEFFETYDQI